MLAFLISSNCKAFIRKTCLWFILEIMEVFPFDLIPCIQKGRQSEAFYMNYIDQKCNGENTSLEFSPARIFLLHRPLSCALCKFFGTEELFLEVLRDEKSVWLLRWSINKYLLQWSRKLLTTSLQDVYFWIIKALVRWWLVCNFSNWTIHMHTIE